MLYLWLIGRLIRRPLAEVSSGGVYNIKSVKSIRRSAELIEAQMLDPNKDASKEMISYLGML